GTLTNSPTWTTGEIGDALSFNAGTSSVAVNGSGDLANLHSSGMTVMAGIKPNSAGAATAGRIVDKDNNNAGWLFAMNSSNSVKFVVDQTDTGNPTRI